MEHKIPSIDEAFRGHTGQIIPRLAPASRQLSLADDRVLPSISIPPLSQLQLPMQTVPQATPAPVASDR